MPLLLSRALLVNPPSGLYRREDRCQSRVEDQTVRIIFPPIDLAVLAAVVQRTGGEARIGDYPARNGQWIDFERDLESFKPDIVLINVTTATLEADLGAATMAKKANPAMVTVAKGEFFEREGESVFDARPDLDLAFFGESEETLEKTMRGMAPQDLNGIVYRDPSSKTIRRNMRKSPAPELDSLPLPARELLDNSLYRSPETGNPLTVIRANRGCPGHCIYCPAGAISDYRMRLRSVDSILEELHQCVERFGIREFLFDGDTFTMNKRWLLELCEKIEADKLDIHWGCNSRVDTMDDERAAALKKAGCWVVAFGVESGDQEMLDRMKKGTRLEQAIAAIRACKKAGLATQAFYIVGIPWETRKSLERTFKFAALLDTDFFDFNIAYPLPGTELYEIVQAQGLTNPELLSGGSYAQSAVRTQTLSPEFLTRWRRHALLKLYARPRFIARTLARAIRTGTLRHYLRAAWQRAKGLM